MSDSTDATIGDEAANAVVGKRNTQNTQRSDPQMRQGDINFTSPDTMNIWVKLMEMAADIRSQGSDIRMLIDKMDNLPDRVNRLERTNVVVLPTIPPAVTPTPTPTPPTSPNLSLWQNVTIALITVLVMALVFVGLIYLRFV